MNSNGPYGDTPRPLTDEERASRAAERARLDQAELEHQARELEERLVAETRLAWRVAIKALGDEGLHVNANTQPCESTVATLAAGVIARMGGAR